MTQVLYSAPIYPPYDKPGSPVYYEKLAEELSADHEVYVIAPYSWSSPIIESKESLTVFRVCLRRDHFPSPVRAVLELISAFIASLSVLLIRSIDVCHVQSTSYSSPGFTLAATITNTPLYYDCRDENFPRWLITRGPTRKWFSCATNIDDRLIECGVPQEDIVRLPVVNPQYVADYSRTPGFSENDEFIAVYLGRLLEAKGVFNLLESVELVSGEDINVNMKFIGDGPEKESLKETARANNIIENVEFTGKVPHEDALRLLSQSDVLVLPSNSEGMPRVIIEAFEIGVPVIASPAGGIPNVVIDRETGIIAQTPTEIANSLMYLYENEEEAKILAKNAQNVVENWSWGTIRKNIKNAYYHG